jgi:DNA repair exonuclease SbcCD ATPase subunit
VNILHEEIKESGKKLKKIRSLFDKLEERSETKKRSLKKLNIDLKETEEYLSVSGAVEEALDKLSRELFGKIAETLEKNLTLALQEVLEQSITLKVTQHYKHNKASISFHVEREGKKEDIMKGQGGSVANILSVGLRFFALQTLDPKEHRRFLVLDEQDCWLRPELVPRLVKIVHEAGKALGFQTLYISHHNVSIFREYADKIYEFKPSKDGVEVKVIDEKL